MLYFYCFIIYMLYKCREYITKGDLSDYGLCGQLNALESQVKLK